MLNIDKNVCVCDTYSHIDTMAHIFYYNLCIGNVNKK